MQNCPSCTSYNRGYGQKSCLRCPKYHNILKKSAKRQTIKIDSVPQAILEQIAEEPSTATIADILESMPTDLSAVLTLRYYARMRIPEIAGALHISAATAKRRLTLAVSHIKINIEA